MNIDDTYRIVLFGHRDFNEQSILDERLCPLLKHLINSKSYVEIYIGRNGEFDRYAATVVKHVQNAVGRMNNELICVLPYPMKNMEYYEAYYDNIIILDGIKKTHPKNAIIRRNRWMTEKADLFVCYVERKKGGAYDALKYAKKLQKNIINFAEKEDEEKTNSEGTS